MRPNYVVTTPRSFLFILQAVEHDRQLTAAQQRYEGEVQLLTHHLRQAQGAASDGHCHCSAASDLSKAMSELKEVKRMNKEMKLKIRDWYHQGLIKSKLFYIT